MHACMHHVRTCGDYMYVPWIYDCMYVHVVTTVLCSFFDRVLSLFHSGATTSAT